MKKMVYRGREKKKYMYVCTTINLLFWDKCPYCAPQGVPFPIGLQSHTQGQTTASVISRRLAPINI